MGNEFSNPAFFISISALYFMRVTEDFFFSYDRLQSTSEIQASVKL